ncbi:MAG: transposase [Microcoleus sp. CSU_2_2]|nr:transposase [Microcoleus sp. SU_5_3]NJS12676.1 transposase [Microcoleus sp. CSU_2_2]
MIARNTSSVEDKSTSQKLSADRRSIAFKKDGFNSGTFRLTGSLDLKLAKIINNNAGWSQFTQWLEYFGKVFEKIIISVNPQYTSQNCSTCGEIVKQSRSAIAHISLCGTVLERNRNAVLNILAERLKTYRRAYGHENAQARSRPLSIESKFNR